jgi:hypothetical protein
MALLREAPNVMLEGFTQFLPVTLQVPWIVVSHICALEVASEDLLEILPAIDHVSRQVVHPVPSRVG